MGPKRTGGDKSPSRRGPARRNPNANNAANANPNQHQTNQTIPNSSVKTPHILNSTVPLPAAVPLTFNFDGLANLANSTDPRYGDYSNYVNVVNTNPNYGVGGYRDKRDYSDGYNTNTNTNSLKIRVNTMGLEPVPKGHGVLQRGRGGQLNTQTTTTTHRFGYHPYADLEDASSVSNMTSNLRLDSNIHSKKEKEASDVPNSSSYTNVDTDSNTMLGKTKSYSKRGGAYLNKTRSKDVCGDEPSQSQSNDTNVVVDAYKKNSQQVNAKKRMGAVPEEKDKNPAALCPVDDLRSFRDLLMTRNAQHIMTLARRMKTPILSGPKYTFTPYDPMVESLTGRKKSPRASLKPSSPSREVKGLRQSRFSIDSSSNSEMIGNGEDVNQTPVEAAVYDPFDPDSINIEDISDILVRGSSNIQGSAPQSVHVGGNSMSNLWDEDDDEAYISSTSSSYMSSRPNSNSRGRVLPTPPPPPPPTTPKKTGIVAMTTAANGPPVLTSVPVPQEQLQLPTKIFDNRIDPTRRATPHDSESSNRNDSIGISISVPVPSSTVGVRPSVPTLSIPDRVDYSRPEETHNPNEGRIEEVIAVGSRSGLHMPLRGDRPNAFAAVGSDVPRSSGLNIFDMPPGGHRQHDGFDNSHQSTDSRHHNATYENGRQAAGADRRQRDHADQRVQYHEGAREPQQYGHDNHQGRGQPRGEFNGRSNNQLDTFQRNNHNNKDVRKGSYVSTEPVDAQNVIGIVKMTPSLKNKQAFIKVLKPYLHPILQTPIEKDIALDMPHKSKVLMGDTVEVLLKHPSEWKPCSGSQTVVRGLLQNAPCDSCQGMDSTYDCPNRVPTCHFISLRDRKFNRWTAVLRSNRSDANRDAEVSIETQLLVNVNDDNNIKALSNDPRFPRGLINRANYTPFTVDFTPVDEVDTSQLGPLADTVKAWDKMDKLYDAKLDEDDFGFDDVVVQASVGGGSNQPHPSKYDYHDDYMDDAYGENESKYTHYLPEFDVYLVELVSWEQDLPQVRIIARAGTLCDPLMEAWSVMEVHNLTDSMVPLQDATDGHSAQETDCFDANGALKGVQLIDEERMEAISEIKKFTEDRVKFINDNIDAIKAERYDLTSLPVISVDPSTAKDLDDAIHVRKVKSMVKSEIPTRGPRTGVFDSLSHATPREIYQLGGPIFPGSYDYSLEGPTVDGEYFEDPVYDENPESLSYMPKTDWVYEVGVHIADVAFVIPVNSALDKEARRRATTVYLPHRAYHMLPGALCQKLCSLNKDSEKLAFTLIFYCDQDYRVIPRLGTRIFHSVITNKFQMHYEQVQDCLSIFGIGTKNKANTKRAPQPDIESLRKAFAEGKIMKSYSGPSIWYSDMCSGSPMIEDVNDDAPPGLEVSPVTASGGSERKSHHTDDVLSRDILGGELVREENISGKWNEVATSDTHDVIHQLECDILALYHISLNLRKKRFQNGSVMLSNCQLKFACHRSGGDVPLSSSAENAGFDIDDIEQTLSAYSASTGGFDPFDSVTPLTPGYGVPKNILIEHSRKGAIQAAGKTPEQDVGSEAHWLIEELMLIANRYVAQKLMYSFASDHSVIRIHNVIDNKKIELLINRLTALTGENVTYDDLSSSYAVQNLLHRIETRVGPSLSRCVEYLIIINLTAADYALLNSQGSRSSLHFALSFDEYTHFTSPIRRIADILVHRELDFVLAKEKLWDIRDMDYFCINQHQIVPVGIPTTSRMVKMAIAKMERKRFESAMATNTLSKGSGVAKFSNTVTIDPVHLRILQRIEARRGENAIVDYAQYLKHVNSTHDDDGEPIVINIHTDLTGFPDMATEVLASLGKGLDIQGPSKFLLRLNVEQVRDHATFVHAMGLDVDFITHINERRIGAKRAGDAASIKWLLMFLIAKRANAVQYMTAQLSSCGAIIASALLLGYGGLFKNATNSIRPVQANPYLMRMIGSRFFRFTTEGLRREVVDCLRADDDWLEEINSDGVPNGADNTFGPFCSAVIKRSQQVPTGFLGPLAVFRDIAKSNFETGISQAENRHRLYDVMYALDFFGLVSVLSVTIPTQTADFIRKLGFSASLSGRYGTQLTVADTQAPDVIMSKRDKQKKKNAVTSITMPERQGLPLAVGAEMDESVNKFVANGGVMSIPRMFFGHRQYLKYAVHPHIVEATIISIQARRAEFYMPELSTSAMYKFEELRDPIRAARLIPVDLKPYVPLPSHIFPGEVYKMENDANTSVCAAAPEGPQKSRRRDKKKDKRAQAVDNGGLDWGIEPRSEDSRKETMRPVCLENVTLASQAYLRAPYRDRMSFQTPFVSQAGVNADKLLDLINENEIHKKQQQKQQNQKNNRYNKQRDEDAVPRVRFENTAADDAFFESLAVTFGNKTYAYGIKDKILCYVFPSREVPIELQIVPVNPSSEHGRYYCNESISTLTTSG